ncbi:TRAP transporter small permease [Gemmobacter sp.]|uniref:TRAP transporter small permease n=1 Tax=Gemmobacter sp. TaxID=1898957 RepID=UPI002AFE4D6A|nr:TRAP transporter small permease subunit [Gemmobacter sp.]
MNDTLSAPVRGLIRIEAGLNRLLLWIAVALLCFSTGGAFLGVLMRYFVGSSFAILEELCLMAVVYASLLYFGPLITRNAHLTMAFLTDNMTPRVNRWFDMGMYVLMTVLLAWLLRAAFGWEMSLKAMGLTTMSGDMQAWVPSVALPIGLAIALFYSVLRVIYRIADVQISTLGVEE